MTVNVLSIDIRSTYDIKIPAERLKDVIRRTIADYNEPDKMVQTANIQYHKVA